MRLYATKMAINPRRVWIYLAEKGVEIEFVDVDTASGAHKRPDFLAKNPAGKIPVLELDDGSYLPESSVIMEYLEERFPEPSMIGTTPKARARARLLEKIGSDAIVEAGLLLRHILPMFASRIKQNPAVVEAVQPRLQEQLRVLESHVRDTEFLAGERPTIADATVFALLQSTREKMNYPLDDDLPRLHGWYGRFAMRPSAAFPEE